MFGETLLSWKHKVEDVFRREKNSGAKVFLSREYKVSDTKYHHFKYGNGESFLPE